MMNELMHTTQRSSEINGNDGHTDLKSDSVHPIETKKELIADPTHHEMKDNDDGMEKDVGKYQRSSKYIVVEKLSSCEMDILHEIKDRIGPNKVTSSAISFAPNWIVEKAMGREHDEKWKDA